jgi:photosystem II stability/assembly factor-like uncharacterized protein
MKKKFLITLFFVFIFLTQYKYGHSHDYWVRQVSPTAANLKNCFFINNNTGWISGEAGTIINTTNAGINWNFQQSNVSNDIQSIFFINERLGWAIAYEVMPDTNSFLGTRILKTTDGGSSWINYMYPVENKFMRSIYFLDSLTGFMAGAPITIVRTGNAGFSWENMDTDSSLQLGLPVENISFINDQVGFACGGFRDIAGSMWTTTNGGFNWKGLIIAPEPFMDLYIFNPVKAIAVGGDFEYGSSFVSTTNQGHSWNYDTLGTFGIGNAVDFRTPYEGWIALGIAQKFSFTRDTGNTWNSFYTPDSVSLNDIQFTDSLHGWAVGYNGVILKYLNTKSAINSSEDVNHPESFSLEQNYPNPFNPRTIIRYSVSGFRFITLKIFDVLGNEITTLVNKKHIPGSYEIEFDAGNLPSGIYYYKLLSEDRSITKKMVVIK